MVYPLLSSTIGYCYRKSPLTFPAASLRRRWHGNHATGDLNEGDAGGDFPCRGGDRDVGLKHVGGGRRSMESVKQKGSVEKMGCGVTLYMEGELRVYI